MSPFTVPSKTKQRALARQAWQFALGNASALAAGSRIPDSTLPTDIHPRLGDAFYYLSTLDDMIAISTSDIVALLRETAPDA